jgi:hypothetical protein
MIVISINKHLEDDFISKLNNLHHRILSFFAEKDNKHYSSFRDEIKDRFGFEKDFCWNILLNSLYVIGDVELAKKSFFKFGFQGPARHEDVGERYLRLYGILNAVYQQFLSILNLIEIYKIPNKKNITTSLRKTRVLILRNKIGSHSSNYINNDTVEHNFDVYEISRDNLKDGEILIIKNQADIEEYDLQTDIIDFDKLVIGILVSIVRKVIKKAFGNQSKFQREFEIICKEIKGDIIIRIKE